MGDAGGGHDRSARAGAYLWVVQPVYLVTEILTATAVTAPYSLLHNTISDLGATTCTVIDYPYGPLPVCSPWFRLMNGSLVVFGLLLAAGAVLLRRRLPGGAAATSAMVLWVVAGLSSIGTGLIPLDRDLGLHVAVSLPVFLAQPAALIASATALRSHHRVLGWSAFVAGAGTLVAAVAFFARADSPDLAGLFERLALWPGYLWAGAAAIVMIGSLRVRPGAGRA
jgi:hypothetical membrane protein